MASPSKEKNVLKLILENSPLKEWHFEELVREAKVTRLVANKWIKKYVSLKLIKRIKERNRFPYYTVGSDNPIYYSLKKLYVLEQFYDSGLISQLLSLRKAKTIILFGSMIKGDWYKDSDIDIFIFGESSDFDKSEFEIKLKRDIELHLFKDKKEINEVKTGLIKNVINGLVIKGQIQDFAEVI